MPRIRKRTLDRRAPWTVRHVEIALRWGWTRPNARGPARREQSELVQQCWHDIGKDLLRDWVRVHPGSRPAAWWLTEGMRLGLEREEGLPNWPATESHTHWDGKVECRCVPEDFAYELAVLGEAGLVSDEEYERLYRILETRGPTRCATWWSYYGPELPGAPVLAAQGDPPVVRSTVEGREVLEPQWVVLERVEDLDEQERELLGEFRERGEEPWADEQAVPGTASRSWR